MLRIPLATTMAVLAACSDGGPGSTGNNDTVFTGLSGLLIVGLLAFFLFRHFSKRGKP